MPSTTNKKRKLASENRRVQPSWETEYFVVDNDEKPLCLICKETLLVCKLYNVQRHYNTHKQLAIVNLTGLEWQRKVNTFKHDIQQQQQTMHTALTDAEMVSLASYKISFILAQQKKPFSDGEMVKQCITESMGLILSDRKQKDDILRRISQLQLSRRTVQRRIEEISGDILEQLKLLVNHSCAYSLTLDESTDICDIA